MNTIEKPPPIHLSETPLFGGDVTKTRCRLLIADDEADLRFLLSTLFVDLGWSVDEAADGHEALAKLEAQTYDLVLLDHRMPGLNGGEVYDRLSDLGKVVPVILVTAAKQVAEIATRHGIPMYLGKPFGIDDLLDLIGRVGARC